MPPTAKRARVLVELQRAAVETKSRNGCSTAELAEALHLLTISAIWAARAPTGTSAPLTEDDWDQIGSVFQPLHLSTKAFVQSFFESKTQVREQFEGPNE